MDWILQPWSWYIGGPFVAIIMIILILLGKNFGFSSNFRTLCSALGAGENCDFFRFDWKSQKWNLLFLIGTIIGGFIAANLLSNSSSVPNLSQITIDKLNTYGFQSAGKAYLPTELFGEWNIKNTIFLFIGGLFIGFGTRYAGGCTSGHAISGLSDLQLPSLIAVIGFFIGGLLMVHIIFPLIFPLIF